MSNLRQAIFLGHGKGFTVGETSTIVDLSISLHHACRVEEAYEYLHNLHFELFIAGKRQMHAPVSTLPSTDFGARPQVVSIGVERGVEMRVEFNPVGGALENGAALDGIWLVLGIEEAK
jgi:hypothetical protein